MDYWCYALINYRLGEIDFTRKRGGVVVEGHSYLGKDERLTQKQVSALQHDIIHNQFSYHRHKYTHRSWSKKGTIVQ